MTLKICLQWKKKMLQGSFVNFSNDLKIFFTFFQLVLKEPLNLVKNLETKDLANPVQILIKQVHWEVGISVNANVEMGIKCFRESKLKNPQCGNCRNLFSCFFWNWLFLLSDAKFKLAQYSNLQKMEDLCITHVQMCSIQLVESSVILDLSFREGPVLECAYLMVNGVVPNQGTVF